jgi:predicted nuclease of predicted toxin-antitoxin system
MRFLADESLERRVALFLRSLGHDVSIIGVDHPRSLPDEEVLRIAHRERRILITNDRDFGELIFRQRLPHRGVIYFRLGLDASADERIERLSDLLSRHQVLGGRFLVVEPGRIRSR